MQKLIEKYNLESIGGCRNEGNYEMVKSRYGKYIETKDLIEYLHGVKLVSILSKDESMQLVYDLLDDLTT